MHRNSVLLNIQLTVPSNRRFDSDSSNFSDIEQRLRKELDRAGATIPNGETVSLRCCSRLPYEEEILRYQLKVAVDSSGEISDDFDDRSQRAACEFSRRWCDEVGQGYDGATRLELLSPESYYNRCFPEHSGIVVSKLSLGSFRNFGMFDERCVVDAFESGGSVDFEHDKKEMTLFINRKVRLAADGPPKVLVNRFYISYDSIHSIIVHHGLPITVRGPSGYGQTTKRPMTLYLRLKHPPTIFAAVYDKKLGLKQQRFERMLDLPECKDDVGRCDIWKLVLDGKQLREFNHATSLHKILSRLRMRSSCRIFYTDVVSLKAKEIEKLTKESEIRKPPAQITESDFNSFKCFYLLTALVKSRSLTIENAARQPLVDLVRTSIENNEPAAEVALTELLAAVDEGRYFKLEHAFSKIFTRAAERLASKAADQTIANDVSLGVEGGQCESVDEGVKEKGTLHIVRIRKVLITPTRTILMAPETMVSNRILREYGVEYFIRCVIRDEDRHKLRRFSRFGFDENKKLEKRIKGFITDGLKIGDRHYKFLAWSNSQLSDHAFYMYARPVGGPDIKAIRDWMGDFSAIKSVPKYLARMGQCFTQTRATITLDVGMFGEEADILGGFTNWSPTEQYNFSDGIGRISKRCALEVCKNLKVEPLPSAFQIRFLGYKGVLVVDPTLDEDPNGPEVVLRKSMFKFAAENHRVLEIVKCSEPTPVCLNRPLIMILDQVSAKAIDTRRRQKEDLRVDWSEVHRRVCGRIFELLNDELSLLSGMLLEEDKGAHALSTRTPLSFDFGHMRAVGFELTREPFFRGMLMAIHRNVMKNRLLKLKIPVAPEDGRTMYGVLDTMNFLQPGQVFVQYSSNVENPGENTIILETGTPVMVTKNPSTVAGDVRMLTAVDVPQLHHLCDVIVFPRSGPRPHPDEMAGSDLDGDEYSVYWDKRMMFHERQVQEPMDYPKPKPIEVNDPVTGDHIANFFWEYTQQDSVGKLAFAHLAIADRDDIFSPVATGIAKKYATALDYSRNGVAADPLTSEERPKAYPEYMEKSHQPMYKSHRLVGRLYRRSKYVSDVISLAEKFLSSPQSNAEYFDNDLVYSGWEFYESDARDALDRYSGAVQGLLDRYGILDECSLVSGHMASIRNRFSDGEKEDFSYYNAEKIIEMEMTDLRKRFRHQFFREFGGESLDNATERTDRICQKASAWYHVAYGPDAKSMGPKMRSFPWIVWDVLCHIKCLASQPNEKAKLDQLGELKAAEPIARKLATAIEEYCRCHVADMLAFKNHFSKQGNTDPALQDHDFLSVCLVVWKLVGREVEFDGSCRLLPSHVVQLIKYCLGGELAIGRHGQAWKGEALLTFLKRLATCTAFEEVGASILDGGNMSGLRRSLEQLRLACFKCLHHVAWTHGFVSLHIEDPSGINNPIWDKEEMNPLTIVLPRTEVVSSAMENAEKLLQEWTGADQVRWRTKAVRNDEVSIIVSAIGTLNARQKLREILLCDDLIERLLDKQCPKLDQEIWCID